ncbi:superoxide dismutase [Peribacillus kribbensis]|uniref:superoxide dismutase n=1 Tax=Peribacillus kribbensis TaxID=356658 RepID=UPI0003F5C8D3|nr:superoxide dismutase [Peribacillus kribbensis]
MSHYRKYANDVSKWVKAITDTDAGRAAIANPVLYDIANNVRDLAWQLESREPQMEEILELQMRAEILTEKLASVKPEGWERNGVGIGEHRLPPLPFAYDALVPVISEEIMRLHHDKHHKTYVDGLNKAEKMMALARSQNDYTMLKHWEKEAAFHGSGHYLHTIFWEIMNPKGGGTPQGALLRQIEKDFGSFNAFKSHFSEAAKQVEGVGWALLVWQLRSRKLEVLQSEFHMNLTQWDTIPIVVLDVWEHAYYLQYKNVRAQYVENWWRVVFWPNAEARFVKARQLEWVPF